MKINKTQLCKGMDKHAYITVRLYFSMNPQKVLNIVCILSAAKIMFQKNFNQSILHISPCSSADNHYLEYELLCFPMQAVSIQGLRDPATSDAARFGSGVQSFGLDLLWGAAHPGCFLISPPQGEYVVYIMLCAVRAEFHRSDWAPS